MMWNDLRPGSRGHFNAMLVEMKRLYWDADPAYVGLTIAKMGKLNAATALNRTAKDSRRATPPSKHEVTAVEVTVWDNWAHTGGRRPSERKKEPNYDKQRYKVEVEVFDTPEGVPMFGGGNAAVNSIYKGTAIAMEPMALASYLADKRDGKCVKVAWKDDPALDAFTGDLMALVEAKPAALVGPLCWSANKKAFNAGMAVMVEKITTPRQMCVTVIYPDGYHQFTRWTRKRCNGSEIKGPNGEVAWQCRATNRADQSAWRNEKLVS